MFWRNLFSRSPSPSKSDLDERKRVGDLGEDYAAAMLSGLSIHSEVRNPLVPFKREGCYGESDHLLYAEGNVFLIVVKAWKGRLSYKDQSRERILQEWSGPNGQTFKDEKKNPLHQARAFARPLKEYLEKEDHRFGRLYITAIEAFGKEVSMLPRDPEEGLLKSVDVPSFIRRRRHEQFAARPSQWIVKGFAKLPYPDLLVTKDGYRKRGFLDAWPIDVRQLPGDPAAPLCNRLQSVLVEGTSLIVQPSAGSSLVFPATLSKLRLRLLNGEYDDSYRLNDIREIVPGQPAIWKYCSLSNRSPLAFPRRQRIESAFCPGKQRPYEGPASRFPVLI